MTNTNLLKSKRALYGITQKDIANEIKVDFNTYSRKELNKKAFKQDEIKAIIKMLNLNNDETYEIFFAK